MSVTEQIRRPLGLAVRAIIGRVITLGGRRDRRRWRLIGTACAVLVLASTVYAVRQIAHGGLKPPDIVGVLGLPLGAAGLVAALVALRKPVDGDDAELAIGRARTLARQVAEGEGLVRRQLLGDDVKRINVRYVLQPAPERSAKAPPAGQTFSDGAASLPDITAYYRATRPARLVITGVAGAGKTVLALELLLALIADRDERDPVPVRVSLAQWDTVVPVRDLLIERLTDAYDWPHDRAVSIVDHGLVLPVLDGLDEMDPTLPDGSPDPRAPRARAALEKLNAYQDRDGRDPAPLILTCRSAHYDALPRADALIDAARVTVAPVDTTSAAGYLTARARDLPRWQPLLHHLTTQPAGPQSRLLSTPWRLCLTATVYHRTGDPAELLEHHTEADLDHHLLARYITAATDTADNPRRYTPAQTHRWLHQLTAHLAATDGQPDAHTDLSPHELWPLPGHTRTRVADAVLTALTVFLLPLPLAFATTRPLLTIGLVAPIAALAVPAALTKRSQSPRRVDRNRLRTRRGRRDILVGLAFGLAFGVAGGLVVGIEVGIGLGTVVGLVIGLAYGLAYGLGDGLGAEPTGAATPRVTMREDAILGLARGLVLGPTFGLVFGLVGGLAFGPALGPAYGLAFGLAIGLTDGQGGAAARRYLVFLLCSRGRLPFRLVRFLDWACTAGLMRYNGPAYQFRHQELQQWLAAHPDPVL